LCLNGALQGIYLIVSCNALRESGDLLLSSSTWHCTSVEAWWQLLVNTLLLERVGRRLHHSKAFECLLLRHVALLNLITQGKDNLKENMDERNISGVTTKNKYPRDHDPQLTKHTIYMSRQNGVGPRATS
jgi:hypothetical protein